MVDKTKMCLAISTMNSVNLEGVGTSIIRTINECSELISESCKIGNMTIRKYHNYLSIYGSLSKLRYGNNFKPLNRLELKEEINRLEDKLKISLQSATITQLEISSSLKVSKLPKSYFSSLGTANKLTRFIESDTLYYKNQSKKYTFYDKKKEMRKTNVFINQDEIEGNWMRFEVCFISSYLSRLMQKQFDCKSLTVSLLLQPEVFSFFIERWAYEYNQIQKQSLPYLDLSLIDNTSEVFEQLAMLGIENIGGLDVFNDCIDKYRTQNSENNKRPEFYSRTKRKANNINTKGIIRLGDEIKELDHLINTEMVSALALNTRCK